jgi:hypothetical protein
MSATQRYAGSCHCGKVRFAATTDLARVVTCNCSRCSRLGVIWCFVTPDNFALESGEDALGHYTFNRHVIDHRFCTTCGIEPFARGRTPSGTESVAINVRCLEGIDIDQLSPIRVNGRDI